MTRFDGDLDLTGPLLASLDDKDHARLEVMERVQAKYIRTHRDDKLVAGLKFLIERTVTRADPTSPASRKNCREGRALVVVGDSGAGKTTSLERLFQDHPAFPGYGTLGSGCPLVSIDVPGPCTLKQLGRELLAVLGYPLVAERPEHVVWEMVRALLERLGVLVLHLDEAHNVIRDANVDQSIRIRKTLKSLLNAKRHPISLIISGTPDVAPFLETLTENRRRSRFIRLDPLAPDDLEMLRGMIGGLAEIAKLSIKKTELAAVAPRLMHAALCQLGTAVEITHESIDHALHGEASLLTIAHFADVYAARTGNADPHNPFVAPNWADVDCTRVLRDESSPTVVKVQAAPKPKKPKKHKAPGPGRGGY
jgi:hypothetical protein